MKVSIILPIRNEEQFISKTLESIIDQKFKGELEIIISDGMSNDGTREIVKQFQNNHKNIILINNHDKIVPNGFNKALSVAKGDTIIRLDGHSFLGTDFISNCLSVQKFIGADCVGGPTTHYSDSILGHHISIAQSSKFGAGGALFRIGLEKGQYVDTLAFGAYKRNVFIDNGAYDEELIRNQDEEFNFRLIQHGKKIWIDPTIKSTYFVRDSLFKLFMQYYQYGFFKVRVIQKVRALISWRHLVPAGFVFMIFCSILSSIILKDFLPVKLFFGIYSITNLAYSFYESFKHQSGLLIYVPFSYFIMHLSYGIGFITGLFYFLNKWGNIDLVNNNFDKQKFIKNSYA